MKAEWTNADALTTAHTTQANNFNTLGALECVGQIVDVAERKHGKWVTKDESYWRPHYSGDIPVNKAGLYCSECDKRLANAQKYRNFCPNCGADMREETEDAEIHN